LGLGFEKEFMIKESYCSIPQHMIDHRYKELLVSKTQLMEIETSNSMTLNIGKH
jgi:hypothetical protein